MKMGIVEKVHLPLKRMEMQLVYVKAGQLL